jgi:hypothetical protein
VWCRRNLDSIKALADRSRNRFNFVGISLTTSGFPEYAHAGTLPFPMLAGLQDSFIKAYKLGSTPETIVISPEGRVERAWIGAYVGRTNDEVAAFFGVAVPQPSI